MAQTLQKLVWVATTDNHDQLFAEWVVDEKLRIPGMTM